MNKIFMSFMGLMLICFSANSQEKTLKGRILDPSNKQPVSNVVITTQGGQNTTSDTQGNFSLPCKDSVTISFFHPAYESMSKFITSCDQDVEISLALQGTPIDEVEVSANANRQQIYLPQSVVKLQVTELKRGTGLFLEDAINTNVPGVLMERRTISAGQQFNIRGYGNGARGTNGVSSNFDGQGYKVYLNGIPITDAEGITMMDDIDFGSVHAVDVIKGPAGSLYGLAISGAVQLKTEQAERNKVSISQDVMAGSYGLQRYTTRVAIGGESSSIMINYGKQKYDGFTPHTASEKDFVNVTGSARLNDKQSINAFMGFAHSYDQRNGELTIGQYDTLDYTGNPNYIKNNAHSEVNSARAGMSHTWRFNNKVSNVSSVFGTGINSNASSAGGWTDKIPVNFGARTSFNTNFWLGSLSLSGNTGFEIQKQYAQTIGYAMVTDSADLKGYNIIGAQRSNMATEAGTGTFFSEWNLRLPAEIMLTAGASLSYMHLDLNDRTYVAANNRPVKKIPTQYSADYDNMISPHFAINKVFSRQVSVYASYSKGYRAPVTSYFYIPTTGEINQGLQPEVAEQVEFGTKGNIFKERLHYQVAVFQASFFNKMTAVAVPLNSVTTAYSYMVNGGNQLNKGLELLLKWNAIQSETGFVRSLQPFANFCYSDFTYGHFKFQTLNSARTSVVETDYSGNIVAGVPPITANAGLDFILPAGVYGNVTYSYRDAMYFTSDNKNQAKAFSLLNARLGIRRTLGKHFSIDLYAGANNITGTQHYAMLFINQLPDAYIPAPYEANFFGGLNLKYTF